MHSRTPWEICIFQIVLKNQLMNNRCCLQTKALNSQAPLAGTVWAGRQTEKRCSCEGLRGRESSNNCSKTYAITVEKLILKFLTNKKTLFKWSGVTKGLDKAYFISGRWQWKKCTRKQTYDRPFSFPLSHSSFSPLKLASISCPFSKAKKCTVGGKKALFLLKIKSTKRPRSILLEQLICHEVLFK